MSMPGLGLGGSLSLFGQQPTTTVTFSLSGNLVDGVGVATAISTTRGMLLDDTFKIAVALPTSTGTSGTIYTSTSGACTATYGGFGMNDEVVFHAGVVDVTKRYTENTAFAIGITLNDAQVIRPGRIISEVVRMQSDMSVGAVFTWTVTEQVYLEAALSTAFPQILSDGLGITPALSASVAVTILQGLGIAPSPLPSMVYTKTLLQGLGVSDSFRNFFGGSLSDEMVATDALALQFRAYPVVSESINIAPALSNHFYLRVTMADTIGVDDVDALQMVYDGQLADGVEIVAGYVSPDGQFTTWVINTRSGATTEYTNYAFNSFATLDNVCFGAASSGLYKLVGDDDDGTDIIADIKSGFAQWGGNKFTMFKGAYLGVRGGGDFVLKLVTGDDQTYIYSVSSQDMRTTKITIGKGIRTRYFAFELISTGQDFDLDTVEFVPLVSDRRV